jgi:succinate dehydrogenase/fumarate reductase flavoprotein subunit
MGGPSDGINRVFWEGSSVDSGHMDVVVCGGGMAGLCAALEALQQGARVAVLEKASEPGGSMRMSGGTLWTGDTLEAMLRWVPEGDPERMGLVVSQLPSCLDWLESFGITCTPLGPSAGRQGASVDPEQVTQVLMARIAQAGGLI